MKFLILIAASCMFVGISGKVSSEKSTEVTLETIREEARNMFNEFKTKALEIDNDILNNIIKAYNESVEGLESIHNNWKSALIAAQTAGSNQIEKIKNSLPPTMNRNITAVCSSMYSANYGVPKGIEYDIYYSTKLLRNRRDPSELLYVSANIDKQYSKEVDNEKATVKSIRNYIDKILKPLMITYEIDARSRGEKIVSKLKDVVADFKRAAQRRLQDLQELIKDLIENFDACVNNRKRTW